MSASINTQLLLYFQELFNMVVEVPRWSNAKMEVRKLLMLFFFLVKIKVEKCAQTLQVCKNTPCHISFNNKEFGNNLKQ